MAVVGGRSGAVGQDSDFLLHPELLSRDFLLLSLEQQDNDLKPIAEVIENYPQRKEDQVNLEVMVWPPQNTNLNISDYQSKNIVVKDAVGNKEKLTEIFVQHAMPLPQRQLPKSRWGKLMESKRGVKKLEEPHKKSAENIRKRPLIVFDGTSTSTSIKVKKTENGDATQRLHQSCTEKTSTPVRSGAVPTSPVSHYNSSTPCKETKDPTGNHEHLSSGPGSNTETVKVKTQSPVSGNIVKIKRAAPKEDSDVTNDGKPTEAKKKIQHVTWP